MADTKKTNRMEKWELTTFAATKRMFWALKFIQNAFAVGASHRTQLGELTAILQNP